MISKEAKAALRVACEQKHPIANLEYLGLNQRTINNIETSPFMVETIEDLMRLRRSQVESIANIGAVAVEKIYECLGKYHQLEEASSRYNQDLDFQRRRIFSHRFKNKRKQRELGKV